VCWRHARQADKVWFATVAICSLSFGVRGILWHQLSDLHNDEKIGLGTFARRHRIALLRGLGNFIIFPVEVAAFCFMLWHAGSRLAILLLGYYALLAFLRKRIWAVNLVVVVPKPKFQILMLEYYELFFPLAVVLSSLARYPVDAVMVAAHLLLFPRRAVQTLKD